MGASRFASGFLLSDAPAHAYRAPFRAALLGTPGAPRYDCSVRIRGLILASLLAWPGVAAAQEGARPPCGAAPLPAYAPPSAPPNVGIWRKQGAAVDWAFPACSGYRPRSFRLLVALAGSFRHEGSAGELLGRFGRISELRRIRYWSVSDGEWRTLVDDASALAEPDPRRRRRDFSEAELRAPGAVYFEQVESRLSSSAVYRMRVLEFAPDRVVIETENVTSVRVVFLPVAAPGETRSIQFLTRIGPGLWGYYSLSLSAQEPGLFVSVRDASLINRVAAIYRHFVGIPTDREPPPAR